MTTTLLDNSLRHSESGAFPPELHLRLVDEGRVLELEVRDHGRGVQPEHLPNLAQAVSVRRPHIDAGPGTRNATCPSLPRSTYLPADAAVALGCQRCGSSSSMREAGWLWMRVSTSRR